VVSIARTLDSQDQVMTTVCGSYGYTAPEILMRRGYGKEVDIWSLGVITYALLCGYTPFPMDDGEQFLRMARSGMVEFHPAYWGTISEEAKDFVKSLLNPDPTRRPSAELALQHPWIAQLSKTPQEESADLLPGIRKNFNARQQFRKGVNAIRMMQRMKRLSQSTIDPNEVAEQIPQEEGDD
jgi:calcium/calmodulin-dependent protein kinase I